MMNMDQLGGFGMEGESSCGCASSDGKSERISKLDLQGKEMHVTIDGKKIRLEETDINIVELARRNNISIPSPCYNEGYTNGCCKGCVIEIDGDQKYACATPPQDGMEIIIDTDDLKSLRKERIRSYKANKELNTSQCCSSSSSGCC